MMSKPATGCSSVWAHVLNVTLDEPPMGMDVGLEEREPQDTSDSSEPQAPPPRYEYSIEPMVYLAGHGVSLTLCLGVLWLLLQGPLTQVRLAVACFFWSLLAFCSYRAIQGIRYGCSLRIYPGYLEVRHLGPTKVITAAEVSHFREFDRNNRSQRRICLYLRTGQKIILPKVHDPDILWRSLLDDFGIQQAIA